MTQKGFRAAAQGSLDGLCGVYSIINSVSIMLPKPLSYEERVELFCRLVSLLDDGRAIGEIIHEGIGFRKLGELIDVSSRILTQSRGIQIKRSVASNRTQVGLDDFWEKLGGHVEGRQRVALIGLVGKYDHWTVVQSVSGKQLVLADSDGLAKLNKAHCALDGKNTHQLLPTQTYFLEACPALELD